MTDRTKRGIRRVGTIIQSPIVIVITFLISMASFGIALNANAKAASEANERAREAEQHSTFLRNTFCGLVGPLATSQGGNLPQSEFGKSILAGSQNANAKLQCTGAK